MASQRAGRPRAAAALIWLVVLVVAIAVALASSGARADQADNVDRLRQQSGGRPSGAKTLVNSAATADDDDQLADELLATLVGLGGESSVAHDWLDDEREQTGEAAREKHQQQQHEHEQQEARPQAHLWARARGLIGRCTREAGRLVEDFMRPKREYLALVRRYRAWYWTYSALFEATKSARGDSIHLSPSDLISLEFARVERELFLELQAKQQEQRDEELAGREGQSEGGNALAAAVVSKWRAAAASSKPIESTDFLFAALRRLIDRLEAILAASQADLEQLPARPLASGEPDGERMSMADLRASEEFRDSMDRLKRIAVRTARGLVANELLEVGKIVALNALATHLAESPPAPGTSLSYIAPFVALMGEANTPLVVSYLTNVEMRAAMRIIDGYNPVPKIVDKLFERLKRG